MQSAYNISSVTAQDLDNPVTVFDDLISHHSPSAHYLLNWVEPLQGEAWRVELVHDLELMDGTVVNECFPVPDGWLALNESPESRVVYPAAQVRRVRICRKQPLMERPWEYRGEAGALSKPDYA